MEVALCDEPAATTCDRAAAARHDEAHDGEDADDRNAKRKDPRPDANRTVAPEDVVINPSVRNGSILAGRHGHVVTHVEDCFLDHRVRSSVKQPVHPCACCRPTDRQSED